MTSSFVLTLDTHAPRITWGAITGADAGETLAVAYTLDEQGVESATIELPSGGGTFPMRVDADALRFDIPGAAVMGDATIVVQLGDDVGNVATAELVVALGGVIPPVQTPPPSTGGMPRGADIPPTLIRSVSRVGASAGDRVVVQQRSRSSAEARSHYVLPTRRVVSHRADIAVRSTDRTTARSAGQSGTSVSHPPDIIRRAEGPNAEDELLLLDLL